VEKVLFTFIANDRQEKLKRSTLINEFKGGGAQMPDLKSQNEAIKAIWFLRGALMPGPWNFRIRHKLGKADLTEVVNGNNKYEDIIQVLPKNTIWEEAARCWCKVNHREQLDSVDDIIEESLWFNSHIKIGGMTLHKPIWVEEGITQIWDILTEDKKRLLTYREFLAKFKIRANFLEYGGLRKAIPGEWRKKLREAQTTPTPMNAYEGLASECSRKKLKTKTIYKKLILQKATKPIEKMEKWRMELSIKEDNEEIIKSMEKTRRLTPYTKLQSFNYNFFHRNVVYEARLQKMGRAETNKCNTCKMKETITHLYWECEETQALWKGLENLIYKDHEIELTKSSCLLGIYREKPKHEDLIRTLNLVCKYYIHKMKCSNQRKTVRGLLGTVRNIMDIELTINRERENPNGRHLKWVPLIGKL
jgi:hypothetical protein